MFRRFALTGHLWVCLVSGVCAQALMAAQGPSAPPSSVADAAIPPVRDMKLITATSGWVLTGQKILWSNTRGQSWTNITPPMSSEQALDSAYFMDSDHGWAILHSPGKETALPGISVARTTDGGKSWAVDELPADEYFRNGVGNVSHFSFADANHGWVLFQKMSSSAYSRSDLFTTLDGGKSWRALPAPPIFGNVQFFPDATGFLVGGVNSDELYRTTDGGRTWVQTVIPLPEGVHPFAMPEGMGLTYVGHAEYVGTHFRNEREGVVEVLVPVKQVGDTRHLILTTDDAGDTWTLQTKPNAQYDGTPAFFDSTLMGVTRSNGSLSLNQGSRSVTLALPKDLPEHLAIVKADFVDAQHDGYLELEGNCLE